MKVLVKYYRTTGRFGESPEDSKNTDIVVFSGTLSWIKYNIDKLRKNWTVISGIYVEHPEDEKYKKEVLYSELFGDIEEIQKDCEHRFVFCNGQKITRSKEYLFQCKYCQKRDKRYLRVHHKKGK